MDIPHDSYDDILTVASWQWAHLMTRLVVPCGKWITCWHTWHWTKSVWPGEAGYGQWSLIGTSQPGRLTHVYVTEEGRERRVGKKERKKRREWVGSLADGVSHSYQGLQNHSFIQHTRSGRSLSVRRCFLIVRCRKRQGEDRVDRWCRRHKESLLFSAFPCFSSWVAMVDYY